MPVAPEATLQSVDEQDYKPRFKSQLRFAASI